jgi:hypothetical protein
LTDSSGSTDRERTFDLLLQARGIVVPADRRAGALAVYEDLVRLVALLRQPLGLETEPANVFDLPAALRAVEPGGEAPRPPQLP